MDSHCFRGSVIAALLSVVLAPQRGVAQTDTVRVGSHTLRPVTVGVDTIDVYRVDGDFRALTGLNIVIRVAEPVDGRQVMHVTSREGQDRTEVRMDPVTHQVLHFDRRSPLDSTRFVLQRGCFDGWSDFPNRPRKVIQCVAATDRFGSGVLDAVLVGALPLHSGFSARVATFDAFGDITSFPIRVTAMDTIRVAGRAFPAWRAERQSIANGRTAGSTAPVRIDVTTTWWVDAARGRVLQERRRVIAGDTTQESLRVLRNP